MLLGEIGDKVCLCDWASERRRDSIDRRLCRRPNARYKEKASPVIASLVGELEEYFVGTRRDFDLEVRFTGTEFQCRVWRELMRIPYGATISYGELARRVGNPKGVRAVAMANAVNPISILVPCHRVIGSDGTLTGYGGGLEAKRILLNLERQDSLF